MENKFKRHDDQKVIEILRKVKAGTHPEDLAKELGMSPATVYEWCKRANVPYEKRNRIKRDWASIIAQL